jgi:ketopantoate reductase
MRIAVVGAGAIGTWLGAALTRAGHDVHLVARGAHLEAIRRSGVRITGAVVELADLTGVAAPTTRVVAALADLEARTLGLR